MSGEKAIRAEADGRLARNLLYRQPGWLAAHARLLTLLPNAHETITAPYTMAPDPILDAAAKRGTSVESIPLDTPWRGDPTVSGRKAFDEYEKLELFDLVFGERRRAVG